jgi:hypothetical protein
MRMDDRTRLAFSVSVRMALSGLPWTLLTGAEKGARERTEKARRLDVATERVLEAIEMSAYEIRLRSAGPLDQ